MLTAPYLIVAFDLPPNTPDASATLRAIELSIPWSSPPPLPLGVDHVFAMPVSTADMFAKLDEVTHFLMATDTQLGGALRWFVQLCQAADIAGG